MAVHRMRVNISLLSIGLMACWPGWALAQPLVPDMTLGLESSTAQLDSSVNAVRHLIEGGAIRGPNLFHSFESFGVESGQQVYFANPSGIEQVFSRVTGEQASQIDGTLGVLGPADLFLLNPNGILFGPGARLDISGSFIASTAEALDFTTGHSFGAVAPQDDALLSLNVPVGLQLNHTLPPPTQGEIVSRGQLEAGQDLKLSGQQLYLEGKLKAEGDLTLKAGETITIRDTATEAFVATAQGNLTLQGHQGIDILTLQHLEQTPFVSGGDLTLLSDGEISGDAHFRSGGDLRFLTLAEQPGRVVSLYDPILSADGNLVFGDYTGVALKLEATGSIEAGDIEITGPDTALVADGSGSDEDLLASSRAAILRAGGDITVGSIDTSNQDGGDGGPIILAATGNITTTGTFEDPEGLSTTLGSFSFAQVPTSVGNGGPISISSDSGKITTAASGIISSSLRSLGDSVGSGGAVSISSNSGDILIQGPILSLVFSFDESIGDGGDISISSVSGDITTRGTLDSSLFGSSAGSNAGGISLSSVSGDITIEGRLGAVSASDTGKSGNGGNIMVSSVSGDINIGRDLSAFSAGRDESRNGGDILVSSGSGDIIISQGNLESASISGLKNNGDAGTITLLSLEGTIRGNQTQISAVAIAEEEAGKGGKVQLQANQISGLDIFTFSSAEESGDVEIRGTGDRLAINNLRLITSGQFRIPTVFSQSILLGVNDFGQAGNTLITNDGDINLNTVEIQADTNGSLSAGNVNIISSGEVKLTNSQINSNANSEGNAGQIEINAKKLFLENGGRILASTSGSGNGGTITINTTETIVLGEDIPGFESVISVEASNTGRSGNILINTPNLVLSETARITAVSTETATNIEGGSITLSAAPSPDLNIALASGAQISASTSGSSPGGSLNITAPQSISIRGAGSFSAEASRSGIGGLISIATSALDISKGSRISTTARLPEAQVVEMINVTGDFFDQIDIDAGGTLPTSGISLPARFTFTVPQTNAVITDLNIRLSIAHPSNRELTTSLVSPQGTEVNLFSRIGGEGDNFQDTLIDSDAAVSIQAGTPPFIGTFRPTSDVSLDVFNNENSTGNWTLEVQDFIPNNDGVLFRAGDAAPWGIALGTQLLLSTQDQSVSSTLVPVPPPMPTLDNPDLGRGGTIRIEVDQLNLSNSSILAETEGFTRGGDINLSAGQLTLDNSNITVRSLGSGDSGSINIDSSSALLLSNGSLIETNAGGSGNGGNIAITTPFLIGLPGENSDIIANAIGGDGGPINIAAQNLLNFQQQDGQGFDLLRSNRSNDISASSITGIDGTITLNTPNINPADDLAELPAKVVDGNDLIERTLCAAGNKSEFLVTGRGGVPAAPTDTLSALPVWEDGGHAVAQVRHPPPSSFTDVLVEALDWSITVDGKVVLHAAVPASVRTRSLSCHTIQEAINPALDELRSSLRR